MKKLNVIVASIIISGLVISGCAKKTEEEENNPYAGTAIYFYSNESGNYDIYTLSLTDKTVKRIISTSADEKYPFVYRDKIYFAANDDGDYDIYVANIDGSGRTKITNLPQDEVQPVISPNGRYLAFTWGSPGNLKIVLYDLQNSDTIKSFGNSGKTNISPEFVGNDTLLMTLQDYGSVLSQEPWMYIISADTLIHLPGNSSLQEAYWRVKSGKVAYSRMGLSGENPRTTLADFPSFSNIQDIYSSSVQSIYPVWSPDGSHLALSHSGTCRIILVEASAGGAIDTLYHRSGIECYTYATWK